MTQGKEADPERLRRAAEVLRLEAETIGRLVDKLDGSFLAAADLLVGCQGHVVVTGMGKAGLIGAKLSATLASTGTPSLTLHPAEARHGDLGRIRSIDVVVALSNSGETVEVCSLVPAARKIGAQVVAVTGRPGSTLAQLADVVLDIGVVGEACPMGLAPTASTAAMLALGDALAMVVSHDRNFTREEYALYHPAGALGRQLMRVREVMRQGGELPLVAAGTPVAQVLLTMSRTPGRPGAALVTSPEGFLAGLFTDGDLRRLLECGETARLEHPVDEFMTPDPISIGPDELVEAAEALLRSHKRDQIPVLDDERRPVGLLDIQDLLDLKV